MNDGTRVIFAPAGMAGTIISPTAPLGGRDRFIVRLDSGPSIVAADEQLAPEDSPAGRVAALAAEVR